VSKIKEGHQYGVKPLLDYDRLQTIVDQQATLYQAGEPFPHIVIDNLFSPDMIDAITDDFPFIAERNNHDEVSGKAETGEAAQFRKHWVCMEMRVSLLIRCIYWELNSAGFLNFLQKLTGIHNLIPDPHMMNGGLHETRRGGHLMVHADYMKHLEFHLDRRINAIIYLNNDWREEYGGHLELWDKEISRCYKRVTPKGGRCVIFSTSGYTFHGHPHPLECPEGMARRSIAMYYYTNGRPAEEVTDFDPFLTLWKAVPDIREEVPSV
jgi:hypothetical protein